MTLAEMADYVCGKVRQEDADSVTKCKGFLRRRFEMIWNEELWRDSVFGYPFTFTPDDSSTSPAVPERWGGIYLFPHVVDRVLAVRKAEGEIGNEAAEMFYRWDPDWFAESGPPMRFVRMPLCVTLLPEEYAHHDLNMASSGPDAGVSYTVVYLDSENQRHTVTQTFSTQDIGSDVRVVERATKLETQFDVALTVNGTIYDVVECPAASTSFPLRIPIQFLPRPEAVTAFRALVKKKVVPWTDDNAEPELNGVDNCLMAFAHADMLQRARQYGKAQSVVGEATALLQQLKTIAVVQEAHKQQIVPYVSEVSGSVEEWGSGKESW